MLELFQIEKISFQQRQKVLQAFNTKNKIKERNETEKWNFLIPKESNRSVNEILFHDSV
jgi:hypothetical protein